jgi:hypothetical protein
MPSLNVTTAEWFIAIGRGHLLIIARMIGVLGPQLMVRQRRLAGPPSRDA